MRSRAGQLVALAAGTRVVRVRPLYRTPRTGAVDDGLLILRRRLTRLAGVDAPVAGVVPEPPAPDAQDRVVLVSRAEERELLGAIRQPLRDKYRRTAKSR